MTARNLMLAGALLAGLVGGSAAPALAHGDYGYGGGYGYGGYPGMMMGPGMGQGMMGPGMMGPGMMGPGMMGMTALPKDLSVDEVRHVLEHHVAWHMGAGFKVGKVEEKDADTFLAEIVSGDGSVVQRLEVDRHTGWMQPVR